MFQVIALCHRFGGNEMNRTRRCWFCNLVAIQHTIFQVPCICTPPTCHCIRPLTFGDPLILKPLTLVTASVVAAVVTSSLPRVVLPLAHGEWRSPSRESLRVSRSRLRVPCGNPVISLLRCCYVSDGRSTFHLSVHRESVSSRCAAAASSVDSWPLHVR